MHSKVVHQIQALRCDKVKTYGAPDTRVFEKGDCITGIIQRTCKALFLVFALKTRKCLDASGVVGMFPMDPSTSKVYDCLPYDLLITKFRGALHSLETAYEIFPEQKDLYGFLKDFS